MPRRTIPRGWSGRGGTPTVTQSEFLTDTPQNAAIVIDGPTKIPLTLANTPAIFGHFSRNDESIDDYGDPQGSSDAKISSWWSDPSGVIFYGLAKSGAKDDATDFEPFGTAWSEIFARQSSRHSGQTLLVMLDTSAKSKPTAWIEGRAGKLALNPRCVDVANTTGWNNARCTYTGN